MIMLPDEYADLLEDHEGFGQVDRAQGESQTPCSVVEVPAVKHSGTGAGKVVSQRLRLNQVIGCGRAAFEQQQPSWLLMFCCKLLTGSSQQSSGPAGPTPSRP